jgi:hypothetical protein
VPDTTAAGWAKVAELLTDAEVLEFLAECYAVDLPGADVTEPTWTKRLDGIRGHVATKRDGVPQTDASLRRSSTRVDRARTWVCRESPREPGPGHPDRRAPTRRQREILRPGAFRPPGP